MASCKVSVCFVALICFVATLHNAEGRITTKSPPVCLNPDWNTTSLASIARISLTDFWTRIDVSASDNVKSFGATIKKLYDNSDSPSLQSNIIDVSFLIYALNSNPNQVVRLCAFSKLLNETIEYKQTKENCDDAIAAVRTVASVTNSICSASVYNALCTANFEIPSPPDFPGKCYRNGAAFDIKAALDIWGATYPCSLRESLKALHRSKVASDVAVALIWFTQEVEPFNQIGDSLSTQQIVELNRMLFSKPSKSCCHIRAQRASQICGDFQQQASGSVEEIIHSYFYDN